MRRQRSGYYICSYIVKSSCINKQTDFGSPFSSTSPRDVCLTVIEKCFLSRSEMCLNLNYLRFGIVVFSTFSSSTDMQLEKASNLDSSTTKFVPCTKLLASNASSSSILIEINLGEFVFYSSNIPESLFDDRGIVYRAFF